VFTGEESNPLAKSTQTACITPNWNGISEQSRTLPKIAFGAEPLIEGFVFQRYLRMAEMVHLAMYTIQNIP
jgi:hypothetical protein